MTAQSERRATHENGLVETRTPPGSTLRAAKWERRFRQLKSPATRRLFIELVRANFKLSDHNSVLGALWSILNPLVLLLILYLLFQGRFGQGSRVYSVYLLLGIVTVGFFTTVTHDCIQIFARHKVTFLNSPMPKEAFIAATLVLHLSKFLIELCVCVLLSLLGGVFPWSGIVLLWPLIAAYMAFTVGIGLVLAILYAFVRDVEHVWTVGTRLLLFITPVFYTLEDISPGLARMVYWVNPVTPFLLAFRGVCMGVPEAHLWAYLQSLVMGGLVFLGGYRLFLRYETRVVERV